jgi:hypothetical protein
VQFFSISSFATELWHLYLTFGLLVGLGHALVFPVGIIMANSWFKQPWAVRSFLCAPVRCMQKTGRRKPEFTTRG